MEGSHPLSPPDPQRRSEAIQTFKATDSAAFSGVFCVSLHKRRRRICTSVFQVSPKQARFANTSTKGAFSCFCFFLSLSSLLIFHSGN